LTAARGSPRAALRFRRKPGANAGEQPVTTLLIWDELFLEHHPGPDFLERPERLQEVRRALEVLPAGVRWGGAQDATREQLQRVHGERYLAALESHRGRAWRLEENTALSDRSVEAAVRAAGACAGLVDALLDGDADNGFALVRPPGHHAEPDRAMGFCLLNNAAIAAEQARVRGVERVAILDWDLHHGNGTQACFEERSDVLYLSTHRYPFYPGTGEGADVGRGAGRGFSVNVALPTGLGDADLTAIHRELVLPILERFAPGMILVSAGFDAHALDPLGGHGALEEALGDERFEGGMHLTSDGFAALCGVAMEAARMTGAPLALLLEGGYNAEALGQCVRACVEVLAGRPPPSLGPASRGARAVLREAWRQQRPFWGEQIDQGGRIS
jgi:acetoin utilization deacetylase AcuC-like enzyme